MKEYKLNRHIPDIVPPKNLEEVIERVVTIEERRRLARDLFRRTDFRIAELEERLKRAEELINELKEIHDGRGKEGNEKEVDV
tara:strand:+ start:441 stop:689 length:249 start_codon:yes stop_codon:yes gene_type:complete